MSVIRGGKSQQISIYDILVGDVVILETGDFVPADGLYIDGSRILPFIIPIILSYYHIITSYV